MPTEPVTRWQAAIASGYSQVLMLTGRFDEARTEAERAIDLARQVPDGAATEGSARNNLGVALAHLGELDRGIEELRAAAQIARESSDDVDDVARAIVNLSSVLFDAGRFAEALAVSLGGIATVEQLGLQRRKGVWCRCDAADALLVLGRSDEAEALLREAFVLHPEGVDAVRAHAMRGALALRRGHLDEARSELLRARSLGRHVVDGHLVLPLYQLADRDDALAGRVVGGAGARRGGGPARVVRRRCPVPHPAAGVGGGGRRRRMGGGPTGPAGPPRSSAGAPCARSSSLRRNRRRRGRSSCCPLPWRRSRSPAPSCRGPHRRVPRRSGREAAAAWQELGDVYQSGCARLREAECLLAERRRAAAADALRAAHRAAIAARAMHLLRAVEATADRARLPLEDRPAQPAAPFHLSARESEVLTLLARGRTDRQIGAELFISHRTVERHVSNILAKLDARTRAELTAIAHRDGLISVG